MRTTIDRAGRLVIPRALRERVGMTGGGEVEVSVEGAAIRVEPISGTELHVKDRLLVIPSTGATVDGKLVEALIDADRHGRR
jgi:AbrB family looped-hinge helix DNA binding protein